mgnify:CR=1 FL=1|jgi:hypothetical protein
MKKIMLVVLTLIVLSGCSITRIDNYDYEQAMDKILSLDIKTYNMVGKGYKYYAPYGVVRTDAKDYNDVLRSNKGNIYYLYVDVVSYYYNSDFSYEQSEDAYFYKELGDKEKSGYIVIEENDDELYVQMVYNYAKIETYVKESDLKDAIIDISYVLSSMEFNDSLLKKMYESGDLDSKEEVYKLFENKEREGNFLEYIEEYDKYDGSADEVEEKEIIVEETTEQKSTTTTKSSEPATSETTQDDNGSDGE